MSLELKVWKGEMNLGMIRTDEVFKAIGVNEVPLNVERMR